MDLLPEHYRDVLECRFIKNYSLKETARQWENRRKRKSFAISRFKEAVVVAEQFSLAPISSSISDSLEGRDE